MSSELLRAEHLSCERDGRHLFNNFSFSVQSGSLVHLVGPNGAGKTTLLKILTGLYSAYEGDIVWNGEDIRNNLSEYQSNILFIGHKPAIKFTMSPMENLRFLCALSSVESDQRIALALQAVGLGGFEHVKCANLSAGQIRRVSLARLYLTSATLWFLDEAFTAIDIESTKALEKLLSAKADAGITIVLTTHHALDIPNVTRISVGDSG